MRRICDGAPWGAITEVPQVGDGLIVRILGTRGTKLDRERTGSKAVIGGCNSHGGSIPSVGNLPNNGSVKIETNYIEASVCGMLHDFDNSAPGAQKVGNIDRPLICVDGEISDPTLTPIGLKIGILILRRERRGCVPGSADRAVAA